MSDTPPKILATRNLPPNVEARLVANYRATTNREDRILSPAELLATAAEHDGILCAPGDGFSAEVLAALPDRVRIISTFSVGYDHIDVPAATARGVVVTNTPDVLTDATADVAMLCLLGAARRANEGQAMVREATWEKWTTTMLLGIHVSGKRLGIYGMGRIGRAVAQRARGFGMAIHYYNRSRLSPDLEAGATYHPDPGSLLEVSDFLSINAPSSPATRRFLDAAAIERLPQRAVVVNTARGNLVDDGALIAALRSGRVAGAGLDVFDGEPDIDSRYRGLANAFLLPHLGSATHETRDAMGFCCLDNLDAFFAGRRCPNALG